MLTENTVAADDKRACFVGLATYESAGGTVLRDLFSEDDDCLLQDVGLLEKLVTEKLTLEAETIKAEGWKWIQVAEDFPYGHTKGMRRIVGEEEPLSEAEEVQRDALNAEMQSIERQYFQEDAEDMPEEIERRVGEIETALAVYECRPVRYYPDDITRAGVFVSIDDDGSLNVERGFLRAGDIANDAPNSAESPKDEDATEDRSCCVVFSSGLGGPEADLSSTDAETEDEGLKPLSERLMMELTAHRTLGLRDALANDPDMAFLAVLHALVQQVFYRYATNSCLEITAKSSGFSVQAPDLKTCASAIAIEERHELWEKQLPKDEKDLWDILRTFDADSRMSLFAHCASLTVNAVHEPWNRAPGRKVHADQLAEMLTLDMAAIGWQPTAANYLGRVSKARILEAVTDIKGASSAELIGHLSKLDMAQQAERMLAGSGWLPEPLRTPGIESLSITAGSETAETLPPVSAPSGVDAELPAFLTEAA